MLVMNHPAAIAKVSLAAKVAFIPRWHQCLARMSGDDVLGGIIYTSYHYASMEMHVAGFVPQWLNRELLWAAFDYPFRSLNLLKVISPIPETNKKSLAFCLNLGFKVEATIADVFPDGGMNILSLYKDDCRFLKMPKPKSLTFEGSRG